MQVAMKGHKRWRSGAWQLAVFAGIDAETGKQRYVRSSDLLVPTCPKRSPDVEHDPLALAVPDLDTASADLLRTPMNPYSHASPRLHHRHEEDV